MKNFFKKFFNYYELKETRKGRIIISDSIMFGKIIKHYKTAFK